jgi:hypothetical protein
MHTKICRPDDAGDDNEDTENLDADADEMNPVACVGLEGR